jgi:protein ImuB
MASDSLAREHRVFPGMSISEATALLPTIRLLEYDPQEDLAGLLELAHEAWQFSPIVGLEKLDAQIWAGRSLHQPQAFFLEANGLTHLFDGSESMLLLLNQWLCSKGYVACLAMAPSIGAAWALANYSHRSRATQRLLQQRRQTSHNPNSFPPSIQRQGEGSEFSGSSGLLLSDQVLHSSTVSLGSVVSDPVLDRNNGPISLVTHVDLAMHICPLPIEGLRLNLKTTSTLHQLGIRSIEALLKLPRVGLANRLGETLLQRIDSAYHGQQEVLHELKEQMLCSVEMKLEYPTQQRTTIEEILRRLTQQLCSQLRQHGHGALRITACLQAEQGPAYLLSLGLYRATADADHLLPLLLGQLESEVFQPPRRKYSPLKTSPTTSYRRARNITAVSLTATLTNPLVWKQVELFDTESQQYRNIIARHIDSVASRLGRRQVVAPQLQRHPQPELACQWRPLTGQRLDGQPQSTRRKLTRKQHNSPTPLSEEGARGGNVRESASPSPDDPMRRPLHLYQPPQPISVQSVDTHGILSQFSLERETYVVQEYWGPERIESGWWDAAHHRRDYYRVATDRGPWFWLYRDLQHKGWFLHGVF